MNFRRFAARLAPLVLSATAVRAEGSERAFLKDNGAAMDKMMSAMAVKPTGDIDADFADMMEPHHQGAIDMAILELRYGKNERLRRIAQEIIVDQQQEIVAMRLALGRPLPPSDTTPDQPALPAGPRARLTTLPSTTNTTDARDRSAGK